MYIYILKIMPQSFLIKRSILFIVVLDFAYKELVDNHINTQYILWRASSNMNNVFDVNTLRLTSI